MHAQPCPIHCEPLDCSPQGPSVHVTFQARIWEWVAIPSSRESSQLRDWAHISCTGRQILYHWATWEALGWVYAVEVNRTQVSSELGLYWSSFVVSWYILSAWVSPASSRTEKVALSWACPVASGVWEARWRAAAPNWFVMVSGSQVTLIRDWWFMFLPSRVSPTRKISFLGTFPWLPWQTQVLLSELFEPRDCFVANAYTCVTMTWIGYHLIMEGETKSSGPLMKSSRGKNKGERGKERIRLLLDLTSDSGPMLSSFGILGKLLNLSNLSFLISKMRLIMVLILWCYHEVCVNVHNGV